MPEYPRPLSDDARAAVAGYVERLDELLDSCADHQRHDPEVFLWNARRALEAVCHVLLTVHVDLTKGKKPNPDERSLDTLIKEMLRASVVDEQYHTRFETVRRHSNLGVHIRQPEREDYPAAVEDVATALPGLVDWLFTESLAAPYLSRPATLATKAIRNGGRESPPPLEAARLAAELSETATRRMVAAEAERDAARREAKEARASQWRRVRVYLGTAAVVGLFAFASGLAAQPWLGSALGRTVASFAQERVALATEVPPIEAPGVNPPAPPDAVAPAPTTGSLPETCPGEMIRVAATEVQLGQPEGGRTNWPRPSRRILPRKTVPAFCLDATARTREEFGAWEGAPSPSRLCPWDVPGVEAPPWAMCLTRSEAEAYCAATVPGGHLPGMLEWEAARRAEPSGLSFPDHEWSGERFPTAELTLHDAGWDKGDGMWVGPLKRQPAKRSGVVLLSWNQQDPDLRNPNRTFRCAAPLGG